MPESLKQRRMRLQTGGDMLVLGYDPGGVGAGGACVVAAHGGEVQLLQVGTYDSVDEVLALFCECAGPRGVVAAGIDALLSWATRASGWREVDRYLRRTYPEVANSVLTSNTIAGSMAVQGMGMALRLRQVSPEIQLNETHPKVLYFALSGKKYSYARSMVDWLSERVDLAGKQIRNEHEWDAVFSAWATVQGMQPNSGWQDLMDLPDDLLFPAGQVTYRWPVSLTSGARHSIP